jgi:hypothetical protein
VKSLCQHFGLPPFAKSAKDGAPACVSASNEIKSPGHPSIEPIWRTTKLDWKDYKMAGGPGF